MIFTNTVHVKLRKVWKQQTYRPIQLTASNNHPTACKDESGKTLQ